MATSTKKISPKFLKPAWEKIARGHSLKTQNYWNCKSVTLSHDNHYNTVEFLACVVLLVLVV